FSLSLTFLSLVLDLYVRPTLDSTNLPWTTNLPLITSLSWTISPNPSVTSDLQ
ncbi:unnamed protein product, partial [Ilex paraguariensis]